LNGLEDAAGSSAGRRPAEVVGYSETEEKSGAGDQDQEAEEDQNVDYSGEPVSRMSPLRQPELENVSESKEWPVKTDVALCVDQRREPLCNDVCKARQP
jgi:hypothetical protein